MAPVGGRGVIIRETSIKQDDKDKKRGKSSGKLYVPRLTPNYPVINILKYFPHILLKFYPGKQKIFKNSNSYWILPWKYQLSVGFLLLISRASKKNRTRLPSRLPLKSHALVGRHIPKSKYFRVSKWEKVIVFKK